jgi:ribokinase
MTPQVTVVGSLNADVTLRVARLPGPGETVLTEQPSLLSFGGKGGNQAAAAAAFGGRVAMIGRVGDDDLGSAVRADLADRGVDVSQVLSCAGVRTGSASIAVDDGGENNIIVDPGANACLRPEDVSPASFRDAAIALVQLEIPVDTVAAVVAAATCPVVLNPAPALPLPSAVLDGVSVLVLNVPELAALTEVPAVADPAVLEPLARKLQRDVVVTLGANGALVVPAAARYAVHIAPPQADIRDTTGAGDCFCGTLAVLLAEGADLAEASRMAVAAGTLSATAPGARGRLPGRELVSAIAPGLTSRTLESSA